VKLILAFVIASGLYAQQTEKPPLSCGDPTKISAEFRDIAGDAYDKVESLKVAELKGKLFFDPILQQSDLAVRKAERKATNSDEKHVAACLASFKVTIELYRVESESWNAGVTTASEARQRLREYEQSQKLLSEAIRQTLRDTEKKSGAQETGNDKTHHSVLAPTGSLRITSKPTGAEIYVDGAFFGNAPGSLKLNTGKHTIHAVLLGYREWTKEVSVFPDSDSTLVVELERVGK